MTRRLRGAGPAAGVLGLVLVAGSAGCGMGAGTAATDGRQAAGDELRVIQHEEPRRDFAGPRPARFRWSPIQGADRYAIGLWNETDRLLWRHDEVPGPQIEWPAGLDVEPGTFFWSVSALQQGREIAKSGLAAFVVEQ
jgi:hypothetical protein